MNLIKMFGERNAGTNYLKRIIELNLNVRQMRDSVPRWVGRLQTLLPGEEYLRDFYFKLTWRSNLGWKHSRVSLPAKIRSDIGFVTVTKNPYAWLLSLHKRPYHQHARRVDFETFLASPWRTIWRDNLDMATLRNPILLWNIKNKSYLDLAQQHPTILVRYEDMLRDPSGQIERIATTFDLKHKTRQFVDLIESTKKDTGKDNNYYKNYYLNEQWRIKLSPRAVELINKSLDTKIMEKFGYVQICS
jgi:hypothetical protein